MFLKPKRTEFQAPLSFAGLLLSCHLFSLAQGPVGGRLAAAWLQAAALQQACNRPLIGYADFFARRASPKKEFSKISRAFCAFN